jgi:hypothetical protein
LLEAFDQLLGIEFGITKVYREQIRRLWLLFNAFKPVDRSTFRREAKREVEFLVDPNGIAAMARRYCVEQNGAAPTNGLVGDAIAAPFAAVIGG